MKTLKAISSSLLAVLILLSSMGFFVDHMVCGMSGEHRLAINQTIGSCSDNCTPMEEEAVERSCCDYESFYFQEDVPATASNTKDKQVVSAFRFLPLHEVFMVFSIAEQHHVLHPDEPDVSTSVRQHILFGTFLI